MDYSLELDATTIDEGYAFSTQREQASNASEIELRPLVSSAASAIKHDESLEMTTDLHTDTDTTTSPGESGEPAPTCESSLHSPRSDLRIKDSSVVRKLVFDSWIGEAIVMALSVGCLAAIALIVLAFDGRRIPQFSAGLTLNTIVSVLSTAARSGMLFVVSASMGQLKWCWLGRSGRRLMDIQAMDDASRGPLGAITMLSSLTITVGTKATLGAVITVLTIAFGPFLQQLLAYPLRDVVQDHVFAWAPQNLNYTSLYSKDKASAELYKVLEAGTWSTQKPLEPACPTARCEWDNFKSTGWCTKCEDRTETAVLSDCNIMQSFQSSQNMSLSSASCTLDLGAGQNISLAGPLGQDPPRLTMDVATEAIWVISSGTAGTDRGDRETISGDMVPHSSFVGEPYPLLVLGYVRSSLDINFGSFLRPENMVRVEEASQCVLSLCERDVAITSSEGLVHSTMSSPKYGNTFVYQTMYCWQPEEGEAALVHVSGVERSSMVSNTWVDRSRRAFCPVSYKYGIDIADYLVANITTTLYSMPEFTEPLDRHWVWTKSNLPDRGINTVGDKSTRSLQERLENIATALTNYGLETTDTMIRGRAYAEESYVQVRWWWILLPALLQLSTLILFITTVVYSHRNGVPIWKSSILAIIYHEVEDLDDKRTLAAERLSGMDAIARMDKVQLSQSADGIHHLYGRSNG